MSINFKSDPTLSAEPFPSAPAEKDIITLLAHIAATRYVTP